MLDYRRTPPTSLPAWIALTVASVALPAIAGLLVAGATRTAAEDTSVRVRRVRTAAESTG